MLKVMSKRTILRQATATLLAASLISTGHANAYENQTAYQYNTSVATSVNSPEAYYTGRRTLAFIGSYGQCLIEAGKIAFQFKGVGTCILDFYRKGTHLIVIRWRS